MNNEKGRRGYLAYHLLAVKDVNALGQCLQVAVRANEATVDVIDVAALRRLRCFYLADTCWFVHFLNIVQEMVRERWSRPINIKRSLWNIDSLEIRAITKAEVDSGWIDRIEMQGS